MQAGNIIELEKRFNELVMEWNRSINLVSRKKTNIYDLIADSRQFLDYIDFRRGLRILDLGTGGGLPGIVIKINHPEIHLTLVDSIQKKINAVSDIISKLRLQNVEVICARAEELVESVPRTDKKSYYKSFDYIVARSVAALDDLAKWSKDLIKEGGKLVTVKGGNVDEEMRRTKKLKYVKNIELFNDNERKAAIVNFL